MQTKQPTQTWDISVPLLSNPYMLGAMLKVLGFAVIGVASMLSLIFFLQGDAEDIGPIWLAFAAVGGGLFVLSLLIMAGLGNRMDCRFTVDQRGILFETTDRRIRASNRWAIWLGLLLGKPQAVGAGILGRTQEVQSLAWRGAFVAQFNAARRVIILRNRWRRLMLVYCTADNYEQIAARIAAEMLEHGTASRMPQRSPVPRYLARSGLVILACIPLFLLVEAFDLSLMLPLLQLLFGLATVWMIGLFGYVLLAVNLLIIGSLLLDAVTQRQSWLERGVYYARWTVYSEQDWGLLALAAVCMLVLAILGWRAAHGRPPAMLQADFTDSGE